MIDAKPTTHWLDELTLRRIERIRMVQPASRSAIVRAAVKLLSKHLELEFEDYN